MSDRQNFDVAAALEEAEARFVAANPKSAEAYAAELTGMGVRLFAEFVLARQG